jgi:general secretion pathway protein I
MSSKQSIKSGFTLLEVLISLAIVGGLLVTLLYTLNYHLGIADRHEIITQALFLAKGKMYALEKSPIKSKGSFQEPYNDFSYETTVKSSSYPGMIEIGASVRREKEEVRLGKLIKGRFEEK